MTMERASELVKSSSSKEKIDLFDHFERLLNPHRPYSDDCFYWQETFAIMCGFAVARSVQIAE